MSRPASDPKFARIRPEFHRLYPGYSIEWEPVVRSDEIGLVIDFPLQGHRWAPWDHVEVHTE